jgi:hypothetical protein
MTEVFGFGKKKEQPQVCPQCGKPAVGPEGMPRCVVHGDFSRMQQGPPATSQTQAPDASNPNMDSYFKKLKGAEYDPGFASVNHRKGDPFAYKPSKKPEAPPERRGHLRGGEWIEDN